MGFGIKKSLPKPKNNSPKSNWHSSSPPSLCTALRYVYFEYENSEAVLEAAEAHKDASFMDNQLLVIKALCVRKERYGEWMWV